MARNLNRLPRRRYPVRATGQSLLVRIGLGLLFVVAVASAVAIYFRQEDQMSRITARHAELIEEQAIAGQRYEELLALQNQAGSDAYIEQIAREKLGMVRPGEIIFDDP
jgi:cell division protein FtsB